MAQSRSARGLWPASALVALVAGTVVAGPDVIVGDIPDVTNNGGSASKHAYAIGTTSCNLGNAPLTWNSGTNQHPVISQNMYRYVTVSGSTRFEQIGQAWLKHGFCALQGTVCDSSCPGTGGCGALQPTCSDPYSSGLNNDPSGMGPKSEVNAATGAFPYPWVNNGSGSGTLFKRLQCLDSELGVAGARYFVAAMYVQPEDAAAGNKHNNESYREVTLSASPTFSMSLTGSTQRSKPGVQAWKDIDSTVTLSYADVPGDGRFIIASKATSLGGSQYHYEYAVQNLNSDRSGQAFSIPLPAGAVVTNIAFHDVDYHSGEPYALTDWTANNSGSSLTWATQTVAQNVNANALRWDTVYNFRFDCNVAPAAASGVATISLFKNGSPATTCGTAVVPTGATGGTCTPVNDACANAIVATAGSTSFDTTFAVTDGPAETLCNNAGYNQVGNDVWFKYTALVAGTTSVSTCGSSFDTKVAIYPNATCPVGADTCMVCNDDSGTCGASSLQSYLTFTAVQGTTYLIRVGGYSNGGGPITAGPGTLTITPPGPTAPPNDNCANALTVAYPSVTAFNTTLATTDGPNETTACNFFSYTQVGSDIWYKFVSCASGTVTVSTCGATYDSKIAVYNGPSCPSVASAIACNDDASAGCSGTLQSQLNFTAVNGNTYLVRVGGYNAATGSGNLSISGPAGSCAPANNDCQNRAGLGLGSLAINTTGASTDGPGSPCGAIGQDIWYNHPATCTGQLTITMCGNASTFDSMLAVYANAGCANLAGRLISCNNDGVGGTCSGGRAEIKLNIVATRNYTIRIGGAGAAAGTGTITLSCVPHCLADWDGSGTITPADVASFVNDWFASLGAGTVLGDFDNDGAMTPADVASFVNQWFSDLSAACS